MAEARFQPASIDPSKLECLQGLEANLGKVLVALEPRPSIARLSDEELRKLQEAEEQLGVVIVAYDEG